MKFLEIFRFELTYQLRRAWTWLIFVVLFIVNFLMTRDNSLSEALYADFFVNSPFAIAKTTVFGSLIWLVTAPIVAGAAAARDVELRMFPLVYTAPISKAQYLGGRFLAAFFLNAIILLAIPAGILSAIYLPGVDAAIIGPFRLAAYLTSFSYIALANALIATVIQFALALWSGRPMASYLGSMLLVFMGFFIAAALLFKRGIGTLLDPIGIRFVVEDMSHLWTTTEKSWRLIALEGVVLQNRLLWFGIALIIIVITYLSFRFAHRTTGAGWWRLLRGKTIQPSTPASSRAIMRTPISILPLAQRFGFTTYLHQTLAIAWTSFRAIATSWAGLALLIAIPLMSVLIVIDQMEADGGVLVPTTIRVVTELTGPLSEELSRWVIIPAFIIYFAGALVWREREARLNDLTDAMPGSDWAPLVGKFLGIGLVLVFFLTSLMLAGMFAQVLMDYQQFEIGLYLKVLFGLQLPEYLLFSVLALVVHVVVNQKYIGHLVAIIIYVFIALSSLFGIEHNLLIYGASPVWSYTDMRGFGPTLGPWLWFKGYWVAWALLLAVAARLLWVRGREGGFWLRLQEARHRFTGITVWTGGMAIAFIIVLGGFIFYNTNVLNQYFTATEMKKRQADYERHYTPYKHLPQPLLTRTNLRVEIYPDQRTVDIRGSYHLVNPSTEAIDSILIATITAAETRNITFDRQVSLVHSDKKFGHQMYKLVQPLQPGDSLRFNFQVYVKPNGFRENGVDASITANSTFFTNSWLPTIGYQESRELISASDRRAYGLPPRPLIASLYEPQARKVRGSGIAFEAVIGTKGDQVAGAPGALRRIWTEGSRRYYHYTTDGPIGGDWVFFSGKYAMYEAQWKNPDSPKQSVAIRIFHQPKHTAHLERMLESMRASLAYYSKHFGPYWYSHISVVEGPGNGNGMHADPSVITHSEGFTFWNARNEPGSVDFPFAIVAHEMAHQWTVPYANVEGAPVMSESLAWYYAMKVVKHAKGPEELQRLLHTMRQPYPIAPIRRGEPLLRGLDQYLSYRRGPFALYALSEYMGDERVNLALRRLLDKHRPKEAPLATTLDLYRELQGVTPDSLKYLLHDLFEVNTYWDLRVEQATVKQTGVGSWLVWLEVQAHKKVNSEAGVESQVPMNDWVEIGIFGTTGKDGQLNSSIYLQKHRIRTGKQVITVPVSQPPVRAGIDPNYLLIDLKPEDNIRSIE
jgi:hypothetical protein